MLAPPPTAVPSGRVATAAAGLHITPRSPTTPVASAGRPPLSLAGAEPVAPGATAAAVVTPQALITPEAAKPPAASSAVCDHVQVGDYVLVKKHEKLRRTSSKTGKLADKEGPQICPVSLTPPGG